MHQGFNSILIVKNHRHKGAEAITHQAIIWKWLKSGRPKPLALMNTRLFEPFRLVLQLYSACMFVSTLVVA